MATRRRSKSSRARRSKGRGRGNSRAAVRAAWRDDLNDQLRGHRSDELAMLLAVLGVIAALGIYSDVAGPAGHAIDRAAAAVLGGARYLVPFALLFGGLALLVPVRARASDDDEEYEDDERPGRGWRLAVGVVLTGVSIVGLMYVGHDDRRWTLHTLQHAGGVFGAAVGGPLRAGLGSAGAVIRLVSVGVLRVLLGVGTRPRPGGPGLPLGARFVGPHPRGVMSIPASQDDVEADEAQ